MALPKLLRDREVRGGGQWPQPFAKVPPSMLTRIEDVEDVQRELRGCIILGFTRDGHHLVSYTTSGVAAAAGAQGLSLQLWALGPSGRLRRAWSVPLFRTGPYLSSLTEGRDEFAPELEMSITVAEAPDGSLLAVHGRSADPRELSSHDPLPNYLTLLPGPLLAPAARRLRAAHLCYQSLHPHPLWNPFHVMHALGLSTGGPACPFGAERLPTLALGLFSVDLLRHVHVAARLRAAGGQQQVQARQQRQQRQGNSSGGSGYGSSSISSSSGQAEFQEALDVRWSEVACWQPAAVAGPEPAAEEAVSTDGGAVAEVLLAAPAAVLDVEAAAFTALQRAGIPTSWLRDYAAVPVMQGCWQGHDGTLVLVLLHLQDPENGSEREDSETEGERAVECCTEEAVPACGGRQRQQRGQAQQRCGARKQSACLLLHAAAACGTGSTVELLQPPYPWQVELSQDLVQQLALAGVGFSKAAAYFADWLRTAYGLPQRRLALPTALTNKSVLAGGRSLPYIAHPWLPQAILGYERRVSGE